MTSAGIGLWALVALAQTGSPSSVPVRVEFDAPAGCSDAETFFAGVLARTRHVHRASPGETAVRLTVRVTRAGAAIRGELRVNEAGGEAETRRVEGATCAEVVQVLSLTAALAIDPTANILAPVVPEKPPAPGSPVRGPAATAAPPSSGRAASGAAAPPLPARAGAAPTPVPAPVSPAPAASSPAVSPVAPATKAAAPPAPARTADGRAAVPPGLARGSASNVPAEPGHEPVRSPGARFGASAVAARVLTSSVALGGSFWGRFWFAPHGALTPSVTVAAFYLPGDFFESGDNLGIGWMALALTACPGWAPAGRVRIEPCARITGGVLSATDHSVNNPRSVSRWWGSAGALVRLTAPLGAGLMLDVEAGVDFPFVTRRFITGTDLANQPVGATTSVSPTLAVGLSHGL